MRFVISVYQNAHPSAPVGYGILHNETVENPATGNLNIYGEEVPASIVVGKTLSESDKTLLAKQMDLYKED